MGSSRVSGLVHMRPDALVRDLRSRTGHEAVSIKEHYETGFVCAASVKGSLPETRCVGQSGASMRSIQRQRSSESANIH